MKREELRQSGVVFDEERHTYELDGLPLRGITPIIGWLFPDTYKGIPQAVLDKAAEYGKAVHQACEAMDAGLPTPVELAYHTNSYSEELNKKGLVPIASEYIVTDGQSVASGIDKVFDDNSIGDIKTTSKVHLCNVQIQLSIYAWLYEKMNDVKVPHLYVIWLPKPQYGEADIMEVERIPADVCKYVVEVYVNGGDVLSALAALSYYLMEEPTKRVEGEIPDCVQPLIDELIIVKKQLDIFGEREKEIKAQLLEVMQERGEDRWSNDLIQFSRRAESERVSIDTKALQKSEPSIYEKFKKVTKVAASLTYKVL